jgi:hypothetical protein
VSPGPEPPLAGVRGPRPIPLSSRPAGRPTVPRHSDGMRGPMTVGNRPLPEDTATGIGDRVEQRRPGSSRFDQDGWGARSSLRDPARASLGRASTSPPTSGRKLVDGAGMAMLSMGAAKVVVAPAENLRVEPDNATVSSRSFLGGGERVPSAPPGQPLRRGDSPDQEGRRAGRWGAPATPSRLVCLSPHVPGVAAPEDGGTGRPSASAKGRMPQGQRVVLQRG